MVFVCIALVLGVLFHVLLVRISLVPFARLLRSEGGRRRLVYVLPIANVLACQAFLLLERPLDGAGLANVQRRRRAADDARRASTCRPDDGAGSRRGGPAAREVRPSRNIPLPGNVDAQLYNFPPLLATTVAAQLVLAPLSGVLPPLSLLARSWLIYLAFLQACAA